MGAHTDSEMPFADPEKQREYNKRRYWENREKQLAEKAEYYRQNREALIAKVKARTDPEAKRQYDREYNLRPEVRERKAQQRRQWDKANPTKANAHNKVRSHVRRGARPDREAQDYMRVLYGDPCAYCGEPGEHVDHIVPLVAGGTSEWSNLTSACQGCNYTKRDKSLLRFLAY